MTQQHDDDWDGRERRKRARWHVGHEIPLALIVTLALQTGAGVWFFAGLSNRVDLALETLREFKAERYTKEDARRDREFYMTTINSFQTRQQSTESRIEHLERTRPPVTGGR